MQITAENLSIGYYNNAIKSGLNFTVSEGDYLAIIGENGCGKSTLMKTLLGLTPALEGKITFSTKEIGYLPQQTQVQRDFPASVEEIVLSGCQNQNKKKMFYSKEQKALAKKNIERMGISNLAKSCYRELSGGQQQRVLLARALCTAGKILLLDEPVSALDPNATEEMYKLIASLNKDEGVTIIMISHDIKAALDYASHVLKLGEKCFFGTKDEYIKEYNTNA